MKGGSRIESHAGTVKTRTLHPESAHDVFKNACNVSIAEPMQNFLFLGGDEDNGHMTDHLDGGRLPGSTVPTATNP
jgi:hypothetical protein